MDNYNESLIDPKKFHNEIDLSKLDLNQNLIPEFLLSSLKMMIMIRLVEQKLAKEKEMQKIGGPVHLGVGQEAIATAISYHLRSSDRVFGAHRSHSHLLSLGTDLKSFFAEILGKDTGLSRGMGGSMHLWDQKVGFYGSVPIVAGTVPLAVGAGLAAKFDAKSDIAISYLGDSALEEGVVHESLNIASLMNIPIIFVVENNLFGSHMHISQRQSGYFCSRFAKANNIHNELVDGNDIVQISNAAQSLIKKARKDNKPGFIEAITYRWYGHVDWREDIDVGLNRSKEDLNNWKKRDPIRRLLDSMVKQNFITYDEFENLKIEYSCKIESSWNEAIDDPYPDNNKILDYVYSNE